MCDFQNFFLDHLYDYHPQNDEEIHNKSIIIDFIKTHPNCFENNCKPGHVTASAWITNRTNSKFLLTLHKKFQRWLQLGGHSDGNCNSLQVAIREAQEESGLQHFKTDGKIFDIGIHHVSENHTHFDLRFLLQTLDPDEAIILSDESLDLQWFCQLPPSSDTDMLRMFNKWVKTKEHP